MRTTLIKKYLADHEIYEVIGHHILVYIKIIIGYLVILVAIALLYRLFVNKITNHPLVTRIAWGLGVIIYGVGLYKFMDEYMDALVVTNLWLLFFKWNWMFSYKTSSMQWVSIESVADQQDTFADSLFKKGDISIRLEEEDLIFRNVSQPSYQVATILKRKERILGTRSAYENENPEQAKDKYELLVEALGEVVSEYVEKKDRWYNR